MALHDFEPRRLPRAPCRRLGDDGRPETRLLVRALRARRRDAERGLLGGHPAGRRPDLRRQALGRDDAWPRDSRSEEGWNGPRPSSPSASKESSPTGPPSSRARPSSFPRDPRASRSATPGSASWPPPTSASGSGSRASTRRGWTQGGSARQATRTSRREATPSRWRRGGGAPPGRRAQRRRSGSSRRSRRWDGSVRRSSPARSGSWPQPFPAVPASSADGAKSSKSS